MNMGRKISLVLFLAALVCVSAGVTGCSNVLEGYDMDYMHGRYNEQNPIPKAILDDVQKFATEKKILSSQISDVTFGEDHEGRHVAMITQEVPKSRGRDFKQYILYYNKDNERTKVRTFSGTRDDDNSPSIYSPP